MNPSQWTTIVFGVSGTIACSHQATAPQAPVATLAPPTASADGKVTRAADRRVDVFAD